MHIGQIDTEHRVRCIVSLDYLNCWRVLDLYSLESLRYLRQSLYRAEPTGDSTRHTSARSKDTMRPAPFAACLRQSGASLPRSDIEPPRPLQFRQSLFRSAGADNLFTGEWCQANGLDEFRPLIAERFEEIQEL